jgi:hypothetical protein
MISVATVTASALVPTNAFGVPGWKAHQPPARHMALNPTPHTVRPRVLIEKHPHGYSHSASLTQTTATNGVQSTYLLEPAV